MEAGIYKVHLGNDRVPTREARDDRLYPEDRLTLARAGVCAWCLWDIECVKVLSA